MVGIEQTALITGVVVLVGGFLYAAVADLREREVSDSLWQALGLAGFVLGVVAISPGGALPVALWIVVAALTLEHMFAWDERIGPRLGRHADVIELIAYVLVVVVIAGAVLRNGVGPTAVPVGAVAVLVSVVFARVLFEVGVLYGGADAKALMIAALLVPIFPSPLLVPSGPLSAVPSFLPFSLDLLTNAALLSVIVPLGLAVRNLIRGEFSFPGGFTGYLLPVEELPRRFVWVRDPAFRPEPDDVDEVDTSDEDHRRRVRIAQELTDRGVRRVWVTPQIPFLVLMAAGAITALLAGNLVIDLVSWL